MQWNNHSKFEGQHAFLSPSKSSWINWDNDTLEQRYYGQYSQTIGTLLHELAKDLITHKRRLHKYDHLIIENKLDTNYIPRFAYDTNVILPNLMAFVNDGIGFRMSSEVVLYYSDACFGTCDAISYDIDANMLRIHDYKSGLTTAKMEQLLLYSALFVLEYLPSPKTFANLTTELRIYQNVVEDEIASPNIVVCNPTPDEISEFINYIKRGDEFVKTLKERGL